MKKCNTCDKLKPIEEFHKDSKSKDGHRNKCKSCASLYIKQKYEENPQKAKDYANNWNLENSEKKKSNDKKYHEQNKEERNKQSSEYYLNNKERLLEDGRERWEKIKDLPETKLSKINSDLIRLYGITIEQYDRKSEQQNHCCTLCRRSKNEFKKRLSVDHNHTTGVIRDLLCAKCNMLVGVFETKPELVQAILAYLKKHEE